MPTVRVSVPWGCASHGASAGLGVPRQGGPVWPAHTRATCTRQRPGSLVWELPCASGWPGAHAHVRTLHRRRHLWPVASGSLCPCWAPRVTTLTYSQCFPGRSRRRGSVARSAWRLRWFPCGAAVRGPELGPGLCVHRSRSIRHRPRRTRKPVRPKDCACLHAYRSVVKATTRSVIDRLGLPGWWRDIVAR